MKTQVHKFKKMLELFITLVLLTGNSYFLSDLCINSVYAVTEGPSILSTVPADGAKDVDIYRPIYLTFDRELDPATIGPDTIRVIDSQSEIVQPRSVHYDSANRTVVFIPITYLEQDETYQVKVVGVKDSNQFPMQQNEFVFTFETTRSGATPVPAVVATIPEEEEKEVGIKRLISVRFNHDMNANSINETTFLLKDASQLQVHAKSVKYDAASRIAAFVPEIPLSKNMTYTASLTSAVTDTTGTTLTRDYTWSFSTGEADYYNPHGNYTDNTMACSYCHSTHMAQGENLLKQTTQTSLCFTCHDGTGSSYNVKANFDGTDASIQTFHPVVDTGNLELQQLLQCSDCHNPHGDIDPEGNQYPMLLRASDGTKTSYQGNDFCLICHGESDQQFTPTFYQDTAGNHVNPTAAHYDTTKPSLNPASGTEVACSTCHTSHSGRFNSLTIEMEENLCLNCHSDITNSKHGRNIQEEFFGSESITIASSHDLTSLDKSKLECSSCHGPHTVSNASLDEGLPYSDLVDPSNTKKSFTKVTTTNPNVTKGDMTDFCLICHDGSPPIAERSSTSVVPYTIQFPSKSFINNSGWDKSGFGNSVHSTNSVGCDSCHESHGSEYPRLLKRNEDTVTEGSDQGMCLKCHATVSSEFKLTSAHPTLTISGRHSDTETVADKFDTSNRHAECVDCHNPHTSSTYQQGSALCFTCHDQTIYLTGSSSNTTSEFSNTNNPNLHLSSNHSSQPCFQCHVSTPHGSEFAGLLYTSTAENTISQITTDADKGYSGHWTKSSCTTTCHRSRMGGANTGAASVVDPLSPDSSTQTGTTTDTTTNTMAFGTSIWYIFLGNT